MSTAKKITTHLPKDLLENAQKVTGEGITQTLRLALELLAKRAEYDRLRSLKGTYKSQINLKSLREDR